MQAIQTLRQIYFLWTIENFGTTKQVKNFVRQMARIEIGIVLKNCILSLLYNPQSTKYKLYKVYAFEKFYNSCSYICQSL